jgi:hypothetical protein
VIKVGKSSVRSSFCTWHDDEAVNKRQAALLAADANATVNRLLRETLRVHLGRVPSDKEIAVTITEQRDPSTGIYWILWRDKPIAIRTDARSYVKDRRYYLTWAWHPLPSTCN